MKDGINCRDGYDPVKEKHCTKCSSADDHHEFLCPDYAYYSAKRCLNCRKGHHLDFECKEKVETFPPNVGGSLLGKLAKN